MAGMPTLAILLRSMEMVVPAAPEAGQTRWNAGTQQGTGPAAPRSPLTFAGRLVLVAALQRDKALASLEQHLCTGKIR